MPRTSDAIEILNHLHGNDPEILAGVWRLKCLSLIGQLVYDAREETGLSQEDFALKVGSTADEIDSIEMGDGDYKGNAYEMLIKVAFVLGKKFRPLEWEKPQAAKSKSAKRSQVRRSKTEALPARAKQLKAV